MPVYMMHHAQQLSVDAEFTPVDHVCNEMGPFEGATIDPPNAHGKPYFISVLFSVSDTECQSRLKRYGMRSVEIATYFGWQNFILHQPLACSSYEDTATLVKAIHEAIKDKEMTVWLKTPARSGDNTAFAHWADIHHFINSHYRPEFFKLHTFKSRENDIGNPFSAYEDFIPASDQDIPSSCDSGPEAMECLQSCNTCPTGSLEDALCNLDESFSQMVLRLIDQKGLKESTCYHKANVDRKLFSKIRNDIHYRPSKPTVVAFALALELSLAQTEELLKSAGFALSHSSKFDIIVEYCIMHRIFDVMEVNQILFDFDQTLLGSAS